MAEKAEHYNKQGLQLLRTGQLQEAVDFFTKAIELDPQSPDAYHNRGEVLLKIDRTEEGNADIQRAKDIRAEISKGKSNGKSKKKPKGGKPKKTAKLNWQEVESVHDTVFPVHCHDIENDTLEYYDDVYLDDIIGTEEEYEKVVKYTPETCDYPAILEFVNGRRLEVARARLFEPTDNDISIIRQDGHVERVIPLDNIACIRKEGIPERLNKNKNSMCHVETIETVDGNVYHEAIHPEQDNDNVLFGFSTEEQTRFIYSFIPAVNIRKRCQDRYLGEILLEKQFIDSDSLTHALDEHQQSKNMKLGKILARKAKVIYSAIEEVLEKEKAHKELKTGEILLISGLVDEEQVLEALEYQEYLQNMKIGQFLVEKNIIHEKEVCIALAEKFRIPFVDLRKLKLSRKTLTCLPNNFIVQNEILPISLDNDTLTVATVHPDVSCLCDAITKECNCKKVQFVLALPTHIRAILGQMDKQIGSKQSD